MQLIYKLNNAKLGLIAMLLLCSLPLAQAQTKLLDAILHKPFKMEESHKHKFYFYWGYNRARFSKSNIHFRGPHYDFTVYQLSAKDKPAKFGWLYLNPETLSIPQYNFRLGFFLTNRLSVSLGMDHMKYVVVANQATQISGVIDSVASPTYAGHYLNDTISLKPDLLQFEHTNGFNFASLDFEYHQPVFNFWKRRIALSASAGLGGIWMITKTDVRVMNDGLDNDFHIAGFALAGKAGLKLEFWNRFFISSEVKAGYAVLPWVLIKNSAPEIGDHNVGFLEYYMAVGYQFKFFK